VTVVDSGQTQKSLSAGKSSWAVMHMYTHTHTNTHTLPHSHTHTHTHPLVTAVTPTVTGLTTVNQP
jgi:hypothetical protein